MDFMVLDFMYWTCQQMCVSLSNLQSDILPVCDNIQCAIMFKMLGDESNKMLSIFFCTKIKAHVKNNAMLNILLVFMNFNAVFIFY